MVQPARRAGSVCGSGRGAVVLRTHLRQVGLGSRTYGPLTGYDAHMSATVVLRASCRTGLVRRLFAGAVLFAALAVATSVRAQASASPAVPSADPQKAPLTWDSVVIHASREDESGTSARDVPNGVDFHKVTVLGLLGQAYGFSIAEMQPENVIGLPDWAKNQRYDITLRVAPEDLQAYRKLTEVPFTETIRAYNQHQPTAQMLMMRGMLLERFHLRVHYEERERTVFALTVDKGGPKLKQAADLVHGSLMFGSGNFKADGAPVTFFASILSIPLQRIVVDRTGLTGNYNFELHYLPEGEQAKPDNNDPDIFTALREQLGLRVETAKAPVLVVVIDHIDSPTPN
jgi:uncharacterized protein (TIGR03435 family)